MLNKRVAEEEVNRPLVVVLKDSVEARPDFSLIWLKVGFERRLELLFVEDTIRVEQKNEGEVCALFHRQLFRHA